MVHIWVGLWSLLSQSYFKATRQVKLDKELLNKTDSFSSIIKNIKQCIGDKAWFTAKPCAIGHHLKTIMLGTVFPLINNEVLFLCGTFKNKTS